LSFTTAGMAKTSNLPKHTLQDEELSIILRALESFVSTDVEEESLAQNLAKELRNKAGWSGYSKPSTDEGDRCSEPYKACEVCDD